jgi:hypothetical protein
MTANHLARHADPERAKLGGEAGYGIDLLSARCLCSSPKLQRTGDFMRELENLKKRVERGLK